jgi:hypothetical protein
MKTSNKQKTMTLGEFIANVYDTCGKRKARGFLRFVFKTHLIEFHGKQRVIIA